MGAEGRTALDGHGIVGIGGGTEGALAVDVVGEAPQKSEGISSPQWQAGQCSNGRDQTKEWRSPEAKRSGSHWEAEEEMWTGGDVRESSRAFELVGSGRCLK